MEVIIEPDVLKKMLSSMLISKGGSSVFESVNAVFNQDGVLIRDIAQGVLVAVNQYNKEHFLKFDIDGEETIVMTSDMLTKLGWGFKDDEINVKTINANGGEGTIIITGSRDIYQEKLNAPREGEFKMKLKETDQGIMPEKFEAIVLVEMSKNELINLPKSDNYIFSCDGKNLSVEIRPSQGTSAWVSKLTTRRTEKSEPVKIAIEGDYFNKIVANLPDYFWLATEGNAVVFMGKQQNYNLSYLLMGMAIE